jgi:hypothetical protein
MLHRRVVMSEDREIALHLALKAVLGAARDQGIDLDQLAEAAIDNLLQVRKFDSLHVPMAISEIEVAVDALVVE